VWQKNNNLGGKSQIDNFSELLALQPSQPLLRILHLNNTMVSIFPESEEFLIMIDVLSFLA